MKKKRTENQTRRWLQNEIGLWLQEYDANEEHDLMFTIEMKDWAYNLFMEIKEGKII